MIAWKKRRVFRQEIVYVHGTFLRLLIFYYNDFNFTLAQERGILIIPVVFSHGSRSLFKLQECSIALCKFQENF